MTSWRELHLPPMSEAWALGLLRALAADASRGGLVWEVRAEAGQIRYFLGGDPADVSTTASLMKRLIPGVITTKLETPRRDVERAGRVHMRGRHLTLSLDARQETLRALLAALARANGRSDVLAVQVVIGRALAPEFIPTTAADPDASISSLVLRGVQSASRPMHARMQDKLSQYRFRAVVRVGVATTSPVRRRLLIHGLLAALRTLQSEGVTIGLTSKNPANLDAGHVPLRQPLRLTADELLPMLGWPIGDDDLPGLPSRHPKLIPPAATYQPPKDRVFATTTAPGSRVAVGITIEDALRHAHVYGPTGSGKSTLFLHLIKADIDAGRSVVLVDPKRDLAMDVLALIPEARHGHVAVIDPTLPRPAGINPFAGLSGPDAADRRALAAELMLDLFRELFPKAFGPLTADTLHASFLTLAHAPDATLTLLPRLLGDARYRKSVVGTIDDPTLQDFWAEYDAKTPGQQAAAVGPVMTRLRQFLLRPGVRAILDQPHPTFQLGDLFSKPRILVVTLNKGLLGVQSASLLGSLIVSQLWQLILAQAAVPAADRRRVSVYIDEAQHFLHLGDLAEALEQSRSLGAAWHIAHQHRAQMPDSLLRALDANARSKVIFGLEDDEARTAARLTGLDADDFTQLPPYEIYTSLQNEGCRTGWFSARVLPPPRAVSSIEAVLAEAQARYGSHPTETSTSSADRDRTGGLDVDDEPIGRTKRGQK